MRREGHGGGIVRETVPQNKFAVARTPETRVFKTVITEELEQVRRAINGPGGATQRCAENIEMAAYAVGAKVDAVAELGRADRVGGEVPRSQHAGRELGGGDGAVLHRGGHERVAHRDDALVRRELLETRATVEPHAQTHVGVIFKGADRKRGHVRQRGVTKRRHHQAVGHGQTYGGGGFRVAGGSVVLPEQGRPGSANEGKLELTRAAEVRVIHLHAALVADHRGHLRGSGASKSDQGGQREELPSDESGYAIEWGGHVNGRFWLVGWFSEIQLMPVERLTVSLDGMEFTETSDERLSTFSAIRQQASLTEILHK